MRRPGTGRPMAPGGVANRAAQPAARWLASVWPKMSLSAQPKVSSMNDRASVASASPPVMTARSRNTDRSGGGSARMRRITAGARNGHVMPCSASTR